MTTRTRKLFYLLTLFFLLACRTYACSRSTDVFTSDGYIFRCEMFYQPSNQEPTQGYTCSIACPGMSELHTFDIYSNPEFSGITSDELKAQYCPAVSSEPSSSNLPATLTPTLTSVPATQPSVVTQPGVVQPLLSGTYTACDLSNGFINFLLAEPKLDITGRNVVLTMNGAAANCSIPTNNPALYSCSLPAGIRFPAEIIVSMDGTKINSFRIDGAFCSTAVPTDDQDDTTEETAATATPDQ